MSESMDTVLNREEKTISGQLRDIDVTLDMVAQGQLTLREHYAGLAMQGMLANRDYNLEFDKHAEVAVKFADALIEELSKKISDE